MHPKGRTCENTVEKSNQREDLPLEDLVDTVLRSMSNSKRPQRLFMAALFKVLLVFQGKANFRNMSRYSTLSEKRLSRGYGRAFECAQFNTTLLSHTLSDDQDCIAAIDASFVNKAGEKPMA